MNNDHSRTVSEVLRRASDLCGRDVRVTGLLLIPSGDEVPGIDDYDIEKEYPPVVFEPFLIDLAVIAASDPRELYSLEPEVYSPSRGLLLDYPSYPGARTRGTLHDNMLERLRSIDCPDQGSREFLMGVPCAVTGRVERAPRGEFAWCLTDLRDAVAMPHAEDGTVAYLPIPLNRDGPGPVITLAGELARPSQPAHRAVHGKHGDNPGS